MYLLGLAVVAVGIAGVLWSLSSALRTLVLPRPPKHGVLELLFTLVRGGFRFAASHLKTYEAQDSLLSLEEPAALVGVLLVWITAALFGFTAILAPVEGISIGRAFAEAGSSMFTLGFVGPHGIAATAIDFSAAGTGLVIVALQIGYLPTLYAAFNRRETLVTMLESRAGAPAWGPELLARHQLVGIIDDLPAFYARWEEWAADVAETHTTYPSLLYLRSPHPRYSWLVSLVAVLDSAALYLALCPSSAPSQARLCLRMGFSALRAIAEAVGIPFDPDPSPSDPIELPRAEFEAAFARLAGIGFPIETDPAHAWPQFQGWRVNYESVAQDLAARIMAPPAPWTGPRPGLRPIPLQPTRPTDRRPGD